MFKSRKDEYFKTHVNLKKDLKENESSFLSLENHSRPLEARRSAFFIKHEKRIYHIYDDLKNIPSFINQINSELVNDIKKGLKYAKKPTHIIIYCPPVHEKDPLITVWNVKRDSFGDYDFDLEETLDEQFLKHAKESKLIKF